MRTTTLKVLSALTFAFIPKSNAFSQVGLGTAVPFKLSRNSILKRSMASFKDTSIKAPNPHNFSWQQTMLRIKDPARTLPFYRDNFGFTLIHQFNFPQWEFSLYFMAVLPEGEVPPTPGTPEAEAYLWNFKGLTLEFTHNHGSENDDKFEVNNGNVEPHRG